MEAHLQVLVLKPLGVHSARQFSPPLAVASAETANVESLKPNALLSDRSSIKWKGIHIFLDLVHELLIPNSPGKRNETEAAVVVIPDGLAPVLAIVVTILVGFSVWAAVEVETRLVVILGDTAIMDVLRHSVASLTASELELGARVLLIPTIHRFPVHIHPLPLGEIQLGALGVLALILVLVMEGAILVVEGVMVVV